jgi:hypothetical protein
VFQQAIGQFIRMTGKAASRLARGLASERAQNSVEMLVTVGTVAVVAAVAFVLYSTSIAPAVLQFICSGVDTASSTASTTGSCLTPTTPST